MKFYQLALDAQSQQLESQIEEILDSFQLAKKVKAEHLHMSDVYKAIDADCAELKQQLKWEKERLKHMKKVSGVEKSVQEYIHYYNHERIKVKLQGLSPVQYRNQFLKTA